MPLPRWDRYSGGNVAIRKDDQCRAHFYATDNGGAEISNTWNARNLNWFSRFDRGVTCRSEAVHGHPGNRLSWIFGRRSFHDRSWFLFAEQRERLCSMPQKERRASA